MVVNYLNYLKTISRRIVHPCGYERLFLPRGRRGSVFVLHADSPHERDIRRNSPLHSQVQAILNYLDRSPEKRLYCGFGLFAGALHDRVYAAPPVIVECGIEEVGERTLRLDHDLSTLSLNYDLLSSVLEPVRATDDDSFDPLLAAKEAFVEEVEATLAHVKRLCEVLPVAARLTSIACRAGVTDLGNIRKSDEPYAYEAQRELYEQRRAGHRDGISVFEKPLAYFDAVHYFVASVPDQLSTYEALGQLVEEMRSKHFPNRTLYKLLHNALTDQRHEIVSTPDPAADDIVERHLPVSLSTQQRRAIANAWADEMSYIHGPPGTGKSHTIAAIALSAVLLRRTVLIVSQKVPALDVVHRMVNRTLHSEGGVHGSLLFNHQIRGELQADLQALLNEADPRVLHRRIAAAKQALDAARRDIQDSTAEQDRLSSELRARLDDERLHAELHAAFLSDKKHFEGTYHVVPATYTFRGLSSPERYLRYCDMLKAISDCPRRFRAGEWYCQKARKHMRERLFADPRCLDNAVFAEYARDVVALHRRFSSAEEVERRLRPITHMLRKRLDACETQLNAARERSLRAERRLNALEGMADDKCRTEVDKLLRMLHLTSRAKATSIAKRMSQIDFHEVLRVLPVWICEIRNLGRLFPLDAEMFDLVVVDEASQVNLAEILPVFYRAARICVVGDHKQLNLNATGITFSLSSQFDQLMWQKHLGSSALTYDRGYKKHLTVMTSSILDFIRSEENNAAPREVMLDEHYRSLPLLANYTNHAFYDDGLRVMTETCERACRPCFAVVRVSNGKRRSDKTLPAEARAAVDLVRSLTTDAEMLPLLGVDTRSIRAQLGTSFSIGIISMIRNQCSLIESMLLEETDASILDRHEVMCGTPEEFQGHERDLMLFSVCLDDDCLQGGSFYNNANRFNVATSRARKYTIVLYTSIPTAMWRLREYLNAFGHNIAAEASSPARSPMERLGWTFGTEKCDSDLERYVCGFLIRYAAERAADHSVRLFNQVTSCGQKRLDFVLFNERNRRSVAVEVDGEHHFANVRTYSEEHIERISVLRRAGWNIINTPYWCWYDHGWLGRSSEAFLSELRRIYHELDAALDLSGPEPSPPKHLA